MSIKDVATAERPGLAKVAAAIVFGLIGLYLGAITLAAGPTTVLEAGLAAAGLGAFGVWTWVAYLEADRVDRMEGSR